MPKSKIRSRETKRVTYFRAKFKLGGRKSPRSALRMTTEELIEELNRDGCRGRDKAKIRKVLAKRRVVDFSLPESAA